MKIRLKKDKETLYGINIGLAIFTLISLGILIYQYRQGNNTTIGGIRLFLFVHLILQIIFSLFWLPYVIKRKIALKKGREVECQITAIKSKKRNFKSALRNFQFNYMYQKVYYIQVKYTDLEMRTLPIEILFLKFIQRLDRFISENINCITNEVH